MLAGACGGCCGQLRTARADYRRATRPATTPDDAWGRPLDETVVLVLPTIWTYEGVGHVTATLGAELAAASAARAREHHDQAAAIGGQASTAA